MAIKRISVKRELIAWAVERSGLDFQELEIKFPSLAEWGSEEKRPTFNQLEDFARRTRTPFGYLFLDQPPEEKLPIPHFRTLKDKAIHRPSPDLLETVQTMQRRQSWMRDFLVEENERTLPFVGSVNIDTGIESVTESIRRTLGLKSNWAREHATWGQASAALREAVDQAGILVTRNGVVGNNNYRKLNVEEFRGFVLVDEHAPLVFVNGADYEGAQLFTIAHELAHVWLGSGSAFNLLNLQPFDNDGEKFCNIVAAEFLVPQLELRSAWNEAKGEDDPFAFLSRRFKVSPIVVARRALDLRLISRDHFLHFYTQYKDEQEERLHSLKQSKKQSGDFYNTQNVRIGKRFATAVYRAAKEGRVLYRDAFRLTGLYGNTFDKYFKRLGIA